MKKALIFLLVYHACFFASSQILVYVQEGYGTEIFAGIFWFNLYYNTVVAIVHGILLYATFQSRRSLIIWTLLRLVGILIVLNICSYYFNRVLLTATLFDNSDLDEWRMSAMMHGCCLFSFCLAEFVTRKTKSQDFKK
jgi:hypothetical protein